MMYMFPQFVCRTASVVGLPCSIVEDKFEAMAKPSLQRNESHTLSVSLYGKRLPPPLTLDTDAR